MKQVLSASLGQNGALDPSQASVNMVLEAALDPEMAIAMAPAATVVMFEGSGTYDTDPILESIINTPGVNQVSTSWDLTPTSTTPSLLLALASRGVSFFDAAGDKGALLPTGSGNATCYSSQSYLDLVTLPGVTVVGGTQILTDMMQDYSRETSASDGRVPFEGGGGFFASQLLPTYQAGVNSGNTELSPTYRNFPDVSMVSINLFAVYSNGTSSGAVGTSASAPLWAGFMALANEQAGAQGPLGFINPAIYHIGGDSAQYALSFNDVNDGSENTDACGFGYLAITGYDLSTGWGTPKCGLIGQLGSITCASGGPLVNLQTDPANCGACGHSCGSGTCGAAQCQPWPIASQAGFMYGLATDGSYAAWGVNALASRSGSGVYNVATKGAAGGFSPEQLSTIGPGALVPGNGAAITVGNGQVAWVTNDATAGTITISSLAEGGAPAAVVTSNPLATGGNAFAIGLSGADAFVADTGGSTTSFNVTACGLPIGGKVVCSLTATVQGTAGPAVFDPSLSELLVGSGSTVSETAISGSGFSGLVSGQGPEILAIATDASSAYWVNATVPISGTPPTTLSLMSAPLNALSNTNAISIVSGIGAGVVFAPVASDGSNGQNVYLATVSTPSTPTGPSTIAWVPKGGGSLTTIYTTANLIENLTIVNGYFYWIEQVNSDISPIATIWGWRFN